MDCTMVTSRVAAFLDGALGSSDSESFVLHIEACSPCSKIVMEIEAQRFVPLTLEQKNEICGREKFWDDMDSVLCAHLDQMVLAKTACLGPWHRRKVGLPLPMVMAYAAAMLLAVAWGAQQRDRAMKAEVASEHLGQELESERRLAAQPVPEQPRGSTYKVVNYTPQRGTF